MEPLSLPRLIRRHWITFCLTLLLTVAAAAIGTLTARPVYTSEVKAYLFVQNATSALDLSQGGTYTQQIIKSYAAIVPAPIVLDPVIRKLSLPTTAQRLSDQITVDAPLDTSILDIRVSDRSPMRAALIGNAIADSLKQAVSGLSPSGTGSASQVTLTIIQPASTPARPDSPNVVANFALSTLAGLLLGLLATIIQARLDTRVRSIETLNEIDDAPVLGAIGWTGPSNNSALLAASNRFSPTAEAFRALRTTLRFLNTHGSQPLLFTSSVESEGKSTTVTNLAVSTAEAEQRVLLIDADLRRPRVSDYLGLDGSIGLTDVLVGTVPMDNAIQQWGESSLYVLPAGHKAPNPSELLQSEAMTRLLASALAHYDVVMLDSPPLLPVADATILAKATGGAIVVASIGTVRKNQIRSSAAILARLDIPILGYIANKVRIRALGAYGYGYGYGYESRDGAQ